MNKSLEVWQREKSAKKYRHEYKYVIDSRQMQVLKIRAQGILKRDAHVEEDGSYRIRSLYFDDLDNSCCAENEAGTDMRSKFRIRYYGTNSNLLKLEKKGKKSGMTRKESCMITREEYEELICGEGIFCQRQKEKQALFTELYTRGLRPKVIVSYERIPFVAPAGNVRVTLDYNIVSSCQLDSFLGKSDIERPILPPGISILEVKWDEFLPSYIKECLTLDSLQWTSFSKYYLCRKYSTNGGVL